MTYLSREQRVWLLGLALLAAVLAIVLVRPMPEPMIFRQLADERMFFGIANFWNVVSNAPFLLVGLWGLRVVARAGANDFIQHTDKWPYVACFLAVALIAAGSTYYHLAPLDERLMWDRLPISLAFMALLAAMITERISVTAGRHGLVPLLLAGVASVLYWRWSGLRGSENILPYALVQYGATAAIIVIAALFRSRYTRGPDVLIAVAIYALAKLAEVLDAQIYAVGHVVSGHTLKHLIAACAVWWLVRMLELRVPLSRPS